MIRLIAADLDGTLLNGGHMLPDGFFELIGRLRGMGVTFAAASGRQYYNVEKLFMPVRDSMLFIAENGGVAFEQGRCVYSLPMDDKDVDDIAAAAEKLYNKGVRLLLSGEKYAYAADKDADFAGHCRLYCERIVTLDNIMDYRGSDRIIKAALYCPDAEGIAYPAMQPFSDRLNVILSGTKWVDIVERGVNKGNAVRQLMERVGAGYDETMVFGDYLNDLEMMSCCRYSFAMENAHPELKKAAAFTAPSNDDNGVVREILRLIPEAGVSA